MKYSDAAQTAPSLVDSTNSEVRFSGIPEFKPWNLSQKASQMDIITRKKIYERSLTPIDIVKINRLDKFKEKSSGPRSVLIELKNDFIASKMRARSIIL